MPALVGLLSADSPAVRERAAALLCYMFQACCIELAQLAVSKGALAPLVDLLLAGSEGAQRSAAGCIARGFYLADCESAAAAELLPPCIAALSRNGRDDDSANRERAVRGLSCLAQTLCEYEEMYDADSGAVFDLMLDSVLPSLLIMLLSNGRLDSERAAAAELLGTMFAKSKQCRFEFGGAIPRLVDLLKGGSDAAKAAALRAIHAMSASDCNAGIPIELDDSAMSAVMDLYMNGSQELKAAAKSVLKSVIWN